MATPRPVKKSWTWHTLKWDIPEMIQIPRRNISVSKSVWQPEICIQGASCRSVEPYSSVATSMSMCPCICPKTDTQDLRKPRGVRQLCGFHMDRSNMKFFTTYIKLQWNLLVTSANSHNLQLSQASSRHCSASSS